MSKELKTLKDLKNRLIIEEGLRLKPYKCTSNKLTIGVGRNLEDRGITEAEALFLLGNDIEDFEAQLIKALPWFCFTHITAQLVLIDMAFNMGVTGLLAFKNTLRLIKEGEYMKASVEMLDSRWAGQVGRRAKDLSDILALC
jgi:lysozyme